MIVEWRSYDLRPDRAGPVLDRIGRALPGRVRLSPLAAMWEVEVGRRDRIIHFWPWADLSERTRIRARFSELADWPVRNDDDIVASESWILQPAPFSPPLEPAVLGPVYEICVDRMRPHALGRIVAAWEPTIAARARLAPFVGAWSTIIGPLNTWVHVWGYESLDHRRAVVEQAAAEGIWPPDADADLLFVERTVSLARPASYSPLS
jgi:hypothetical protein